MELVNATNKLVSYTLGVDPDAREHVVLVAKETYTIPTKGGVATVSEEQVPFVYADTFTGEPGLSATLHTYDFAFRKPACDVLLLGTAYAPGGAATRKMSVGLRVATMTKHFTVVGKRHWTAALLGDYTPSRPEPFTSMKISYDHAFGGSQPVDDDPDFVHAYEANPVGKGFAKDLRRNRVLGHPVPNTEETTVPVKSPRGRYRPMSFGPIGCNFSERLQYAGTYDAPWLENQFPFLPHDFDDRYYQAAPADQQIPYPKGGETIKLLNLTPTPLQSFELPPLELPIEFVPRSGSPVQKNAVVDTITLEPDAMRLQVLWRASLPLRESIREIAEAVIGTMPKAWYRARAKGKQFVPMSQLHTIERDDDF